MIFVSLKKEHLYYRAGDVLFRGAPFFYENNLCGKHFWDSLGLERFLQWWILVEPFPLQNYVLATSDVTIAEPRHSKNESSLTQS